MPLSPSFLAYLDDAARADLEGMRDWYATCIFWSTLAVVVGCAMEVPEVMHELWPKLFPARFDRRIKVVSSIGLLFVVLGVGGELGFEHWRSGYEGLLQTFDNVLLTNAELHAASAQQAAGDARDSANEAAYASSLAKGSAANAVNLATSARKEADTFEKDIVSAKQQAADAESHLADALQRAASAEKEAALANEKLGGWKLSDETQKRLVKKLKPFAGTRFDLAVNPSEAPFMEVLDKLLVSAGWVEMPPKPDNTLMAILIDGKATIVLSAGIVIEVDDNRKDSLEQGFLAFGNGMGEEGIPIGGHRVPAGSWGDRIHIIIGKRQ